LVLVRISVGKPVEAPRERGWMMRLTWFDITVAVLLIVWVVEGQLAHGAIARGALVGRCGGGR